MRTLRFANRTPEAPGKFPAESTSLIRTTSRWHTDRPEDASLPGMHTTVALVHSLPISPQGKVLQRVLRANAAPEELEKGVSS